MKQIIRGIAATMLAAVVALPVLVSAPSAEAAVDKKLDTKTATLTASVEGFPTTDEARRQLKRSEITVHYLKKGKVALEADVWVKGQPSNVSDTQIEAWLGVFKGGNCEIVDAGDTANTRLAKKDTQYWLWDSGLRNTTAWDCAVVLVVDRDNPEVIYDAQVGKLKDNYITPKLKFGSVELLSKKVTSLKLVRDSAQYHWVTIRNTGKLKAKGVVLTGSGSGMKVKKVKVGTIEPGDSETVRVAITLTGKKKSTSVTLTAKGSGLTVKKKLKVTAVSAPKKAKSGTWKATNGVKFTVKSSAIQSFKIVNARMACSAPGTYTTYRNVTLTFPKTKIPRHGYVEAKNSYEKGSVWYNSWLEARIVDGKLTQGRFFYRTAGNNVGGFCTVNEKFTAKK